MSGLVGALGGLFGGNAAKTDRKNELSGMGDLSNLFNFGFTSGKGETSQSQDLLSKSGDYYSKLLSGDRAATLSAIAPTVSAANSQTDAAKRNIATSGTARGGGTNSSTLTLEDKKRSQIDEAVNSAKAGAASGAAAVGGTMASQASALLGMGERSAESLTELSSNSRKESDALHNEKVNDVGKLADIGLDVLFA